MRFPVSAILFLLIFSVANAGNRYTWTSPSANSSASMPCGGGDIGLNVWVENGDVLFYMARSGTYDENNTLLKQGRIRIKLFPNPFTDTLSFRQTLHLDKGYLTISTRNLQMKIWVDVFKPLIHTEISSKIPVKTEVHYENWRYRNRLIRKGEGNQNSWKWAVPEGLQTHADSVFPTQKELTFYHQNCSKTVFDFTVEQQGLQQFSDSLYNPLKNLISGGKLFSNKLYYQGKDTGTYAGTDYQSWIYSSKKKLNNISFSIILHKEQSDAGTWDRNLIKTAAQINLKKDAIQSAKWWNDFYQRSYIRISGKDSVISNNYALFRYMLGCNARGSSPTKFNGGLFTFDPVYVDRKEAFTPDFRRWGGGTYTAQNQRLVHWPMLKNGDVDLMLPQFEFYRKILKNAEIRSKVYWNHPGACFAEQIENYGLPNPVEYGLKRPAGFDKGVEYNAWLEYQWETVLEFCQMIIDAQQYANINLHQYLPLIKSSLQFFDEHYQHLAAQRGRRKLDGNGHLIIYPSSACETYKMATNPAPLIAGLRKLLTQTGDPDSILKRIPPLPYREIQGKKALAPAKSWERINNVETPQLYPVFPWRIYGLGRPDIETAINTYQNDPDALKFRSSRGWKQDNIWAACLGLTEDARKLTFEKLADGPHRFPAFWGPDFDWTPDHNKGGSGMIGLQEMLLQIDNKGQVILFPAWPKDIDVQFKLHAPGIGVVEASMKNGVITRLSH